MWLLRQPKIRLVFLVYLAKRRKFLLKRNPQDLDTVLLVQQHHQTRYITQASVMLTKRLLLLARQVVLYQKTWLDSQNNAVQLWLGATITMGNCEAQAKQTKINTLAPGQSLGGVLPRSSLMR